MNSIQFQAKPKIHARKSFPFLATAKSLPCSNTQTSSSSTVTDNRGFGMDSWCGGEATIKSRAKQTEESYQLQLALALRLSSQAASANDPYFLDFSSSDNTKRGLPPYSPESLSHRFWVIFFSYFSLHEHISLKWAPSQIEISFGSLEKDFVDVISRKFYCLCS